MRGTKRNEGNGANYNIHFAIFIATPATNVGQGDSCHRRMAPKGTKSPYTCAASSSGETRSSGIGIGCPSRLTHAKMVDASQSSRPSRNNLYS